MVSLSLITVGCIVKFGGDTLNKYTDPVLKKIQESAQGAFDENGKWPWFFQRSGKPVLGG
jgi:hypothetical protein